MLESRQRSKKKSERAHVNISNVNILKDNLSKKLDEDLPTNEKNVYHIGRSHVRKCQTACGNTLKISWK